MKNYTITEAEKLSFDIQNEIRSNNLLSFHKFETITRFETFLLVCHAKLNTISIHEIQEVIKSIEKLRFFIQSTENENLTFNIVFDIQKDEN